uniref:ATP synthase complex subunit 8 n=1 Tax=Zeugodacus depressus TaxID=187318 RepID=A0A343B6V0_ZEUDE|nr:ATP synthase F0 subunit 8 [Zeugodacus depressus]AQT19243.1 ATP synthase F0 subunit 8 [Zeugodacus depressus]WCB98375.1 ATP synthase F0 subunit 8 [Zeugodacus depressus]WGU15881.1 ATP synthase F0 subunit 8 [Zeugodacus depressus]
MPQMAPISWLSLFIIFSITFILFSMMNYYSTLPQTPKSQVSKSYLSTPLNWKW